MKKLILIILFSVFTAGSIFGISGDPRFIDSFTAYSLPKGVYQVNIDNYLNEGLLLGFNVSVFENFEMGVSFGGNHIIGKDDVDWNPRPELHLKYVFIDWEKFPHFAVGYNSQGFGGYSGDGYDIYSKGVFLTCTYGLFSPNFVLTHGFNYTFEKNENNKLSAYTGMKIHLGRGFNIVADYDIASNDDRFEENNGYLNSGVKWEFDENLYIEFIIRDILETQEVNRSLRIGYKSIF